MKRVWEENLSVYGARKLWHAMKREKFDIARCTVERLMRDIGIEGVRRGKKVFPMYEREKLGEGDLVAVAIHKPERAEAEAYLRWRGLERPAIAEEQAG